MKRGMGAVVAALGALAIASSACGPGAAPSAAPSGSGAAPAASGAGAAGGAAGATAGGGGAAAPAAVAASPPTPLRLRVNYAAIGASQTGIWTTWEGGYMQEQGLDAEMTHVANTARAIQSMMQGDIDLSMLEPATAIQISLSGADTVLLFGAVNRLSYSVMTQPALTAPELLRGRVLGITRIGSATHSAARVALKGWGLTPDTDVALRQLGETNAVLAALEAGQIDAGMMTSPINLRAMRQGYHELIDLTYQGPDYVSLGIGGLRGWVAANEEAVRRYARAYAQGVHRFKTDKEWSLAVWRKYLQLDDQELLEGTYRVYRDHLPVPPYVSEAGMARLMEDLVVEDPRLAGRNPQEWVDGRYVRELETSGFLQQLTGQAR